MYPPKVHQFAYVTDEACTEDEILSMEIIIMKVSNRFCSGTYNEMFCIQTDPVSGTRVSMISAAVLQLGGFIVGIY